jgi:hypothetical protein
MTSVWPPPLPVAEVSGSRTGRANGLIRARRGPRLACEAFDLCCYKWLLPTRDGLVVVSWFDLLETAGLTPAAPG